MDICDQSRLITTMVDYFGASPREILKEIKSILSLTGKNDSWIKQGHYYQ